jgi:polyisoprenoid-binding protein YceI
MTTAKTANVSGEVSFNGFTRPATLSVVWNFSGEHPLSKINPVYAGVYASGFSARTQILRSEFGITRSIPLVSDELRITIEAELHRR